MAFIMTSCFRCVDAGNRLMRVDDQSNHPEGFKDGNAGNDYAYDDFGNLVQDLNKGIYKSGNKGITYNHLNLPKEITFQNNPNKKITYLYNALGDKVRKVITDSPKITTTDYQGIFHYENGDLKFFATAEGYVSTIKLRSGGTIYRYVYNYTDHLGNIRLSYSDAMPAAGEGLGYLVTMEENHYYPFGLKHKKYGSTDKDFVEIDNETGYYVGIDIVPPGVRKTYQYKYNGKEFQDELGLNFYDYGARNYDPVIGRWMNVDPLAEKYPSISPYAYVANNPIIFTDPDGREIRIAGADGVETTYVQGMKYEGKDEFTATMINNLNRMNDIEIGGSLLGTLVDSKNVFQITNEGVSVEGAGAQFQQNSDGGGKVIMGNNSEIGSLAHELFHGYQHEKGQGGASIFNEVEAYLFGTAIQMTDSFNSGVGFSTTFLVSRNPKTENGELYEQSVNNLLWNNDFSGKDFNNVVKLFKSESGSNSGGIYNSNKYMDRRDNQKENLIKSFFPLMR